jgi:hypothetical protein
VGVKKFNFPSLPLPHLGDGEREREAFLSPFPSLRLKVMRKRNETIISGEKLIKIFNAKSRYKRVLESLKYADSKLDLSTKAIFSLSLCP